MPICAQCKQEVDKYAYETLKLCESCNWDHSFESSTENSYEVGFNEFVDKIIVPCGPSCKRAVGELLDGWHPLEWVCEACEKVVLTKEQSRKEGKARTLNAVAKGCACGGRVIPVPPKKFY